MLSLWCGGASSSCIFFSIASTIVRQVLSADLVNLIATPRGNTSEHTWNRQPVAATVVSDSRVSFIPYVRLAPSIPFYVTSSILNFSSGFYSFLYFVNNSAFLWLRFRKHFLWFLYFIVFIWCVFSFFTYFLSFFSYFFSCRRTRRVHQKTNRERSLIFFVISCGFSITTTTTNLLPVFIETCNLLNPLFFNG